MGLSRRVRALARMRWLRDQVPLPEPGEDRADLAATQRRLAQMLARDEAWGQAPEETGGARVAVWRDDAVGPGREDAGVKVVDGLERRDLMAWLAGMSGWFTPQSALAALDDLVAGIELDQLLRICAEEGLEQVADVTDLVGDRYVFLLGEQDGLLGVVYVTEGYSGTVQPWSLTLHGNAVVDDFGVFGCSAVRMQHCGWLPDSRSVIGGECRWHLHSARYSAGSLRVALAVLRASSIAIVPWRYPAVRTWFGPDAPRALVGDDSDATVAVSRANTAAMLEALPTRVHTVLGPRLMMPR
ncbi:hypothetical protein [Amycolatopsis sp. NPDC058986]|uniref:hypothetical protein n=1 Tax=unclassified Amycolatopsis TaxID=2618356 RepID=UPI003673408F